MSATIFCKTCGTEYQGSDPTFRVQTGQLVVACGPCPKCSEDQITSALRVYGEITHLVEIGKIGMLDIEQLNDFFNEHYSKLIEGLR